MEDARIGRTLRAIRHRLGWRQSDVAARAGVAQDLVSRIERGRLGRTPVAKVRDVAAALDAEVRLTIHWRGGDLDRLIDEGHAHLVGRTVDVLKAAGWEVRTEVSFSIYGERGSIDVLAWHVASRTLLVGEVKSDLTSVEETIRRHDVKARLAARIGAEQLGWKAGAVGRLLVLPDLSTQRRRVERHGAVLATAYPTRGHAVSAWLRNPDGEMSGRAFLRTEYGRSSVAIARKRIRRPIESG
jgi:transcriptional regulator with XRE-family HTH domain